MWKNEQRQNIIQQTSCISKHKAIQLKAWTVLLGFQEVEANRIFKQLVCEGGKVVSPTLRLAFTPEDIPGTHFC